MKTLLPNKDFFLIENEIVLVNPIEIVDMEMLYAGSYYYVRNHYDEWYIGNYNGDSFDFTNDNGNFSPISIRRCYLITHSTASLQGVKQLDRSLFVKGVDVETLINSAWLSRHDGSEDDDLRYDDFADGFEDGYNANKNEYSYDDMHKLWIQATKKALDPMIEIGFTSFLQTIRPLSLPASITINGDDMKQINW